MKEFLKILSVLVMVTSLAACSGSQKEDGSDIFAEDFPETQAQTDALPEEQLSEEHASPELPIEDQTPANLDQSFASQSMGSGEMVDYTVQKGDTLMKIAFENYGDLYQWRKIYNLNQDRITDPMALSAGTVLKIEKHSDFYIERNGNPYLIKVGDTLGTISHEVYGTPAKWKRVWENNKQLIKDPNQIYAGFYLYYTFTPEDESEKQQYESSRIPATGDISQ